jgi:hypothetical protein
MRILGNCYYFVPSTINCFFFVKLGRTEKIIEARLKINKIAEIGWVKNIPKLPCDINKDCRRHLSIIGPRTMARMKGAPSNPILRTKKPKTPNINIIIISTALLLRV